MSGSEEHTPPVHHHETPPLTDPPDEWHDHSHDEEEPQEAHVEAINAPAVIGIGLLLFFVIVVAVIVVYGYYTYYTTRQLARFERGYPDVTAAPGYITWTSKKQEAIRMGDWGWATPPAAGDETPEPVVRAPIGQAKESVIERYSERIGR